MAKKKADKATKPRKVKTWRIRQDVIKEIEKLSKRYGYSESELIETAVLQFEDADGG
jgi:hypothetical protein